MAKTWAVAFYNSKQWKTARRMALRRDLYCCQLCGARAEEVHHIIELSPYNISDVSVTLNIDNLQSLCHDCHTKITLGGKGDVPDGMVFDSEGYVVEI